MDRAILHDAPLSTSAGSSRSDADSRLDVRQPEHPLVGEAPEKVLQIRLQHPADFTAGVDLVEVARA